MQAIIGLILAMAVAIAILTDWSNPPDLLELCIHNGPDILVDHVFWQLPDHSRRACPDYRRVR